MSTKPIFIAPNWPVLPHIKAYSTTRYGGFSQNPYNSFNLAQHVGDDPQSVIKNRKLLADTLHLPNEPLWLEQVHRTDVAVVTNNHSNTTCADAIYTREFNQVCVVLTADCLPVLLCNQAGTEIAAVHAGWRGLAQGILEATIQHFRSPHSEIMVWLAPAISATAFEVGQEVYDVFVNFLPQAQFAFTATRSNHWLADLYLLAQQRLKHIGITKIYGGNFCTYCDKDQFYSYRRDKVTGRMAHLIWMTQ